MAIRNEFREIAEFPPKIVLKSAQRPAKPVFAVYSARYAFLTPGMGYPPLRLVHGRRVTRWIDSNLQRASRNHMFSSQNRTEIRPKARQTGFCRLYCQICLPDPRYGVSAAQFGPWAECDAMLLMEIFDCGENKHDTHIKFVQGGPKDQFWALALPDMPPDPDFFI